MKKHSIYIAALALLALGSCKKELTQNPSNAVNVTQAFKTENDFNNAVRGAYAGLRDFQVRNSDGTTTSNSYYYGGQDAGAMATTPDVLADNLILNQQGRKSETVYFNYTYVGNNTWNLWQNAYAAILRANYVITNINNLASGAVRDNFQGEALAIRALAHFDLLRVYAKSYTSATDADPGVPYVVSTDPTLLPSRTPVKQAYDLVVQDLTQAETLIGADNGVGRFNKTAVAGLLSRVYLYRGEWQNVVNEASKAISAGGQYALTDVNTFPAIWTDQTEQEVLFKVKILDDDNDQIGVGYEQAANGVVKPEYNVDFALFNLYTNNDVRKTAYIGQTTFGGATYNYVKKYFGRPAGNANVVDYKVLRTAEVYLNRAEAYYNLNNQAAALADLNALRSNRYTGYTPGTESGVALYNAIQLQRRLELAFEGSRFFDLKRLNLPIQRSNFGDNANGTGIPAAVKTVPANSKLFQLPIPQNELNANPNIVQNP